ncbi:MAG: hypothetical protein ACOCRK_08260 [bacterium]
MSKLIKETIEARIAQPRFNINRVLDIYNNLPSEVNKYLDEIQTSFDSRTLRHIKLGLVRFSFLIELVKDDISSTKYEIRWSNRLKLDPRYASFEECMDIFFSLITNLLPLTQKKINNLILFNKYNQVPYELPIDYITRFTPNKKLHTSSNITWLFDEETNDILELRELLLDPQINQEYQLFKNILDNKIHVKTYLTDRALTGLYKTNREKRWETHPRSVQFALRRECLKIEKTLLLQICRFKDAPNILIELLICEGLLDKDYNFECCPITGEEFSFIEFKNTIESPEHGRSAFQVGHLYPLKATINESQYGHCDTNISWISENGNRIQGSLTIDEINNLLRKIAENKGYFS